MSEVAVFPDRLELVTSSNRMVLWFFDIARWPRPAWFWKRAFRAGLGPKWPPVGDRDWFHPPSERYFSFYGDPPVRVYLPDDPDDQAVSYGATLFARIESVIVSGGFQTLDLG